MRKSLKLKGWKLYVVVATLFYVFGLFGLWIRWIGRHPHRSVLDGLSEIAVFTAIATACLLASIAYDQRKRWK
jgi:hypothetical protein